MIFQLSFSLFRARSPLCPCVRNREYISYFSVAVIKCHDQSNLYAEGWIWAHTPDGRDHDDREGMQVGDQGAERSHQHPHTEGQGRQDYKLTKLRPSDTLPPPQGFTIMFRNFPS